ncbi:MAG: hypothetical protein DRQ48_07270 [Gammaproteobacteria bacterium]|nr:MAG: hypothetical protein DRQ58_08160 [Gammaproteobacteria bacterium]RKZ69858.1 MAG: hypothetical protein DRQ48_07270 [Gammaproteobacteria bacterium]
MRALGNYMLLGRLQAVTAISLFTVVSMFIPPLSYLLSGVPAGLIILRKGPAYGMQVLLVCLLAVVLFVAVIGVNPQVAIAFALCMWIPVYLCCSVLRQTQSQGWLVFVAGTIASAYVLVMHWLIADVPAWWLQWMELWINNAFPDGGGEQYREVLVQAAPAMNAIMAGAIASSLVVTSLLSRWWQSLLFNPGGFRPEFYALRLPGAVIFLSLAGIILLFTSGGQQGSAGLDILVVVIFMYLFQGLASVHRIVSEKKLPQIWLMVMYILLAVLPQAILIIACLGLVDSWMNREISNPGDNGQN